MRRAAATVVLLAAGLSMGVFGGLSDMELPAVGFLMVVPLTTGAFLYWLGTQDGL